MERNRHPDRVPSAAPADENSFLDTLMDLLEGAANASPAVEEAHVRAEARLSRQFRAALGARMRDAA